MHPFSFCKPAPMPELPEVETTRRGLAPALCGQRIVAVEIRRRDLRQPIPTQVDSLAGHVFLALRRRGKYLIADLDHGHLLIHLGMSGSLALVSATQAWRRHEHWALRLSDGRELRYHDPRRFGCLLWTEAPEQHPLLAHLGPEPLTPDFAAEHLYRVSRGRKTAIKTLLMDARCVVGIGNIYAQEALFVAGLRPQRAAGSLSRKDCQGLHAAVVAQLEAALRAGGSSLRDYVNAQGELGYFQTTLAVYGRAGLPCPRCLAPLAQIRLSGRSSAYCRHCQR